MTRGLLNDVNGDLMHIRIVDMCLDLILLATLLS